MNKKIARLLDPKLEIYLILMLVFAAGTFLLGEPLWGVAEVGITVLLFLYYRFTSRVRRDKVMQYIDSLTGSVEQAGTNTLMSFPMPTMVFRPTSGS